MEAAIPVISPDRPVNSLINDNYFLVDPQLKPSGEDPMCQDLNKHVIKTVNLNVVFPAPSVTGLSENKDIRPNQNQTEIKCVKPVCCVNPCLYVPTVQNVLHVVPNPPVGARLQRFWQVWHFLGANKRVVSILQEGYTLPFKEKPPLTRSPVIISGYANPVKKQAHKGLLTGTPSETGGRKGDNSVLPGLLQPLVSSTKTQQQMEAHPRSKSAELLPSNLIFQDGDTRDHPTLPSKRGVGDVSGFQRRLLPYPNRTKVAEIPQILPPQSSLSVHSPPLWPLNGSVGVHKGGQGSQVNGTGSGYQNPPVPRRLVAESPVPGNVPTSYPDPLGPMPQVRVGSQYDQVGVGASAGLQLCRLPFRPLSGVGQTDPGEVDGSVPKDQQPPQSTGVSGPTVHVPYRTANSHRETGSSRATSHAPYPVASEEALACPGVIGKDYPSASVPSSTPEVVVEPKQCPKRSAFTPTSTRSSAVYRRLKRRLGCSLRRFHSKRPLVHTRKRLAYKLAGTQGRPASPKTVRAIVLEPDHSGVFRQHNSGLLHKQGGRYEIRLSLCSPLEAADVVQPEADCIKSTAYSGSPQCHCGQVVPARSGDTNGMVPPAGSL